MMAVISLHSLANYLNDPFVLRLWDVQQFAVQIFVFCSAYLFFSRPGNFSITSVVPYFIKRFWRLYKPFLYYLVFFFIALLLLRPDTFSWEKVILSATLIGGIDINWLVLLFVQFILVFPFIQFLLTKWKFGFATFAFIVIYSSVFFFFLPFPYHWRTIMWLTWSFMALYAIFYIRNESEENTSYRDTSYMFFTAIFVAIICVEALYKETLAIYPNKYPPNLVILSYGIVWIGIFEFLFRHGFFHQFKLIKPISFLSQYSYPLFFIHYLWIYILNNALHLHKIVPWWGYFPILFPLSILTQIAINNYISRFKKA